MTIVNYQSERLYSKNKGYMELSDTGQLINKKITEYIPCSVGPTVLDYYRVHLHTNFKYIIEPINILQLT